MKKLVVLSVFALAFGFTSCTGCDRKTDPVQGEPAPEVVEDPAVDVVEDPAAATPATEVAADTVKTTTTTTTEVKK